MTREQIAAAMAKFAENGKNNTAWESPHIDFAVEQVNAALEEAAAQLEFADPESDLDDLADEVIRALKIE